jgi:DtxR family manganese transport transcriptional regulator
MNPRRSKARILFDILSSVERKGGRIKPTHILYGANLAHNRMKGYLEFLLEKGLIVEVVHDGRLYYELTDSGKAFLREFERIEQFTEAFGVEF